MSSACFRRTLPVSLVALTLLGSFVMVGQTSPPPGQTPPPAAPKKRKSHDKLTSRTRQHHGGKPDRRCKVLL